MSASRCASDVITTASLSTDARFSRSAFVPAARSLSAILFLSAFILSYMLFAISPWKSARFIRTSTISMPKSSSLGFTASRTRFMICSRVIPIISDWSSRPISRRSSEATMSIALEEALDSVDKVSTNRRGSIIRPLA